MAPGHQMAVLKMPSLQQAFTEVAPRDVDLWFADDTDQALNYALKTDLILLMLGEHPRRSGENANLVTCDYRLARLS